MVREGVIVSLRGPATSRHPFSQIISFSSFLSVYPGPRTSGADAGYQTLNRHAAGYHSTRLYEYDVW